MGLSRNSVVTASLTESGVTRQVRVTSIDEKMSAGSHEIVIRGLPGEVVVTPDPAEADGLRKSVADLTKRVMELSANSTAYLFGYLSGLKAAAARVEAEDRDALLKLAGECEGRLAKI